MPKTLEHIAIIMDGNGRWAESRSHRRVWGHVRGASVVTEIVEEAVAQNLKALTLYTFSTENWSRPLDEIKVLFNLLKKFLVSQKNRMIKNNIKFSIIGDTSKLPEGTLNIIRELKEITSGNNGLKLTLAFGYGGRNEIIHSVNKFIKNNPGAQIAEEDLERNLFNPTLGDVDLVIRSGGDQRISNFLLWQSAYAELYFTKTQWPDFTRAKFKEIIDDYYTRERRFGDVHSQDKLSTTQEKAASHQEFLS